MDKFRVMKMFCRTVEFSSFSAAAADLEVDAGTLSRQISQLELELGSTLLLRSTRKISVTAAGQAYYEGCTKALEAHETARQRVIDMASSPRGLLRISAPMSFGILYVSKLIPSFLNEYPDAEMELLLDDTVVDILGDGIDAAIRIRTELPDSGLMRRALASIRRCFVAAPTYLTDHGTPQSPTDLLRHNCIEYTLATHSRSHWPISNLGEVEELDITGSFKVNNSLAMCSALVAGCGIGLVPYFAVHDALERGELVEILENYAPPPHTLCVVHGQSRLQSGALKAFADFLANEFAALEANGKI